MARPRPLGDPAADQAIPGADPTANWQTDLVDPVTPWRPGDSHAHDHLEINLLLHGSITYLLGGRAVTLTGPGYGAFWATHPHTILATDPGTRMAYLHLPMEQVLSWDLPGPARRALLAGQCLATPAPAVQVSDEVDRWLGDLDLDLWHRRAAALEVRARLTRLLATWHATGPGALPNRPALDHLLPGSRPVTNHGLGGHVVDQPNGDQASPLRGDQATAVRLAAVIEHRWREDLRVEDLARAVGLRPSRAMAAFKAATGTTIAAHLRRYRIARACQRLAAGDDPITTIGLDCGFSTLSVFYAAFHSATGVTPSDYRHRFRGA